MNSQLARQLIGLVLTLTFLFNPLTFAGLSASASLRAADAGGHTSASKSGAATVPAGNGGALAAPDAGTKARLSEAFGRMPLRFEANLGQTDSRVKFLSRGSGPRPVPDAHGGCARRRRQQGG